MKGASTAISWAGQTQVSACVPGTPGRNSATARRDRRMLSFRPEGQVEQRHWENDHEHSLQQHVQQRGPGKKHRGRLCTDYQPQQSMAEHCRRGPICRAGKPRGDEKHVARDLPCSNLILRHTPRTHHDNFPGRDVRQALTNPLQVGIVYKFIVRVVLPFQFLLARTRKLRTKKLRAGTLRRLLRLAARGWYAVYWKPAVFQGSMP